MIKVIKNSLLLLFLLLNISCAHKGYVISEVTTSLERSSTPERNIDKLVIIDPFFTATKMTEVSLRAHNYFRVLEESIASHIERSGSDIGMELDIYFKRDPELSAVYYNELSRLKQEIQRSNVLQASSLDRHASYPAWSESLVNPGYIPFRFNPKISPAFSNLSENYGTRYFSIMGFVYRGEPRYSMFYKVVSAPFRITLGHLLGEAEGVFVHIVVDVHESEIIYREHREVTTLDETHMKSIIYDSLNIVNNL